jgi:hypothetical protein
VGAQGTEVTIKELTDYPFSESVDFILAMKSPTRFPLSIRIPAWCKSPELWLNGKRLQAPLPGAFHRLDRLFADGDRVTLKLPMDIRLSAWPQGGVAVERGPLVYSLALESRDEVIADYAQSSAQFPAISRTPARPWNFALELGQGANRVLPVHLGSMTGYPWDHPPISVSVPARRIPAWQLQSAFDDRIGSTVTCTPAFPDAIEVEGELETLKLVPYGCTLLRITVFPTCCGSFRNRSDDSADESKGSGTVS